MKKHSRYILSLILLLDVFANYLQASGNPSSRRPVPEKTSPDDQSNMSIKDKIALFQKLNIVLRGTDRGSSWQYDTRKVAQTVQSVCYKNHFYASRE